MHAEIARELAASRDPLRLTLGGVRYVDKPPLLYLLLAGAFVLGGAGEATARAVPALGALVAVAATAWLAARLMPGTSWGCWPASPCSPRAASSPMDAMYVRNRSSWPRSAVASRSSSQGSSPIAAARRPRAWRARPGRARQGSARRAASPTRRRAGARPRGPARRSPPGCPGRVWSCSSSWASPGMPRSRSRRRAHLVHARRQPLLNVARARRFRTRTCPLGARIPRGGRARRHAVGARRGRRRGPAGAAARVARSDRDAVDRQRVLGDRRAGTHRLSPFRLPHYGLRRTRRSRCSPRGLVRERPPLALLHAGLFAVLAAACAIARASGGASFARVLDATTSPLTRPRRPARARRSIRALRPGARLGALVFGAGALGLVALLAAGRLSTRGPACAGTHRPPPPR